MLLPRSIADIEDHRKTHMLLIAPKGSLTELVFLWIVRVSPRIVRKVLIRQ